MREEGSSLTQIFESFCQKVTVKINQKKKMQYCLGISPVPRSWVSTSCWSIRNETKHNFPLWEHSHSPVKYQRSFNSKTYGFCQSFQRVKHIFSHQSPTVSLCCKISKIYWLDKFRTKRIATCKYSCNILTLSGQVVLVQILNWILSVRRDDISYLLE